MPRFERALRAGFWAGIVAVFLLSAYIATTNLSGALVYWYVGGSMAGMFLFFRAVERYLKKNEKAIDVPADYLRRLALLVPLGLGLGAYEYFGLPARGLIIWSTAACVLCVIWLFRNTPHSRFAALVIVMIGIAVAVSVWMFGRTALGLSRALSLATAFSMMLAFALIGVSVHNTLRRLERLTDMEGSKEKRDAT